MKQVVQNYKTGQLSVQDVPPPQLRPGGVLVRNAYSLISAGTERGMIELARKNLLQKARARPDLVRKVLDKARTEGVLTAYQKAMQRLEAPMPLGYSSAGIVIAVGEGVTDLEVGDPVACAGIGYACHAEVIFVPRNLCVKIPSSAISPLPILGEGPGVRADNVQRSSVQRVTLEEAAYTTLGAIALEGVRVADVRIGETVAVIGLGLVGLLTVQILKAAGCRVLGMDINPDRCRLAEELGADAVASDPSSALRLPLSAFGLPGCDAVIITAATPSSEPVHLAGELARDRGRVVVVGIVGMDVPRKLYYEKALELRMSRSYGPGRYDRFYEEKGLEYPIAYVRWTENRNMQAFLQLLAEGKVNVARLTTHRFPIERALEAYDLITKNTEPHIGVLLDYNLHKGEEEIGRGGGREIHPLTPSPSHPPVMLSRVVFNERCDASAAVRVGVIGAGNFARSILLPTLRRIEGVELRGICSQGGLSARAAADRFGFAYCTSDPDELFNDPNIHAVLIVTRPSSHAALVTAALAAGKHVFVEKPLAVNLQQLREVVNAYQNDQIRKVRNLMVGYNRRFSPFARKLKAFFSHCSGPLVAVYRVNANYLPKDDWQHDLEQGGGRIIGEAGHFVDLLSYITGAPPETVWARAVGGDDESIFRYENAAITIRFADGSIGTIVYVSQGASSFSKERLEVFGGEATGVIEDFRRLELVRSGRRKTHRNWLGQDKGHKAEWIAFIEAIRQGSPTPVPFEDYLLTTLCTFQAVESLRTGQPQLINLSLLATDGESEHDLQ